MSKMDYWRKQYENANGDIFEAIKYGILVAVADHPAEFNHKKAEIAEFLFTCHLSPCSGCGGVQVPPPKEEARGGSQVADEKATKGDTTTNEMKDIKASKLSLNEVEALTDMIDEESKTVKEVLRIKEILLNSMDQSNSMLLESLRRLELMDVGFQTLSATDIGIAVSAMKKHHIQEISTLARSLVRSWKAIANEWVAATEAAKVSKDSPDSVNPSGIEEEACGLLSPPLDDGAFFALEANSMELSKFFDDVDEIDEFGNGGRIDDDDKIMTNMQNGIKNAENRKPLHPQEQNVLPKGNNNRPVFKQEDVARQTKPFNRDSVIAKPTKLSSEQKERHEVKLHQRVDANRAQRMPVACPLSEEPLDKKLELAKRKLSLGYRQAEDAKKQRTVQVMELHDIPKHGFGNHNNNGRNSHARNAIRNRTVGRR